MIKIDFYKFELKISGHAKAGEYGNDIYCAGVSAITQGALNWFNENDIKYFINDGILELKILNKSIDNLNKLDLLKIQLKALDKKEYSKFVKITIHKNELKED